jgi:hypothetical protein
MVVGRKRWMGNAAARCGRLEICVGVSAELEE